MHHTAEGALVAATKGLSTETKIKHNQESIASHAHTSWNGFH